MPRNRDAPAFRPEKFDNRGLSHGNAHPKVIAAAERAEAAGLHLTHFNSGSTGNDSNGFRVFLGTEERDHFHGGHLSHMPDLRHVEAFLDGFERAVAHERAKAEGRA